MRVFSDYNKINLKTAKGKAKFLGAMNAFMHVPAVGQRKIIEARLAAFIGTSNVDDDVKVIIDTMHLGLDEVDLAYTVFFDIKDFTNTRVSGFKVRNTSSGLTFSKRPEGGKADIYKVTGTTITVGFDLYGGGLEFDEAWFQDEEWWTIEDTALEFRSKWFRDKASVFYALIGAIPTGEPYDVAYDSSGATQLEDDILTLNGAASEIIVALADAGYAVTASTQLYILSPIQLKPRLERALAAIHLIPGVADAAAKIEYNIRPVYSTNVISGTGVATTTLWYMGAPGLLNKIGDRMDLTTYADFKAESFARTVIGWGRYGGYLNPAQFRRISTS